MAPPRTVLATPTMRLSIADLAACTYRAERCVAIVAEARGLAENPSAEILLRTTSKTSPETVALLESFWRQMGLTPRFELESAVVAG
jgi:3-hydroxybutyryl-CoA dehydrogenase